MGAIQLGDFNIEHQYPCERCKGAGYTQAHFNWPSPAKLKLLAGVLPKEPVPVDKLICPQCQGSGGGLLK